MYTTTVVHMESLELIDVESIARPIVERVVWAAVATVGPNGHPRTRLMHPVWFWDAELPTALISARPTSLKVAHLEAQPKISCHYWDPAHDTVAIDAAARWVPRGERQDAWDRVKAVPEPVGFDPAIIWPDGSSSNDCAFLHLTAHRIVAQRVGEPAVLWRR